MIPTTSSMRITCRVLIAVADSDRPLTNYEISEFTGLTQKQVEIALVELLKKQKVYRANENTSRGQGFTYAYNTEWEPSERPRVVKSRTPHAKLHEKTRNKQKIEARSGVYGFGGRFRGKKIEVLKRLLNKVGPDDRDVLIGIIADYGETITKANAA